MMRSNSPLFDRIRVKPEHDRRLATELPGCQWPGCTASATHRAPKGRLHASEYWQFCLEHVREYNNSYNFFAGMSEDAITKYQKEALTGHRPTWKIKSKFKALVKRHHPDANGGDRGSEARLREIIQAYNYLKSAGFC